MPLVELLTLPEHLSSSPVFSGVCVTWSLVLCVCFVNRCLSFCTFFLSGNVLSVLLRFTDFDYPFGIFKLLESVKSLTFCSKRSISCNVTASNCPENHDLLLWLLFKKCGQNCSWSSRTFCRMWHSACSRTRWVLGCSCWLAIVLTQIQTLYWTKYSDYHVIFWWIDSSEHSPTIKISLHESNISSISCT